MAEDWEQHYVEGVTPWDHGEAAPPLEEVLEEWGREVWGGGPVLVPGCGRGHDVDLLRRHGLEAIGLDVSGKALAEAGRLYGEGDGVRWVEGDLFEEGLGERLSVGAVWEHTCFCAIDPDQREGYVSAMASLLRPGGRLVGVFYLDPGVEEGPPYGATREEVEGVFSKGFDLGRAGVPTRSYPSREGREWLAEFIRRH